MKKSSKNIRVIATKITGSLLLAKNKPCQDFYYYACSGNKLVAVVSDGAGSAKYGKIGAKMICETLVNVLINSPFKDIEKVVQMAVEIARERLTIHRLNKSKSEQEILNFSATMVGVVYHRNRGYFFHIGDGAGVAVHQADGKMSYTLSRPANGNFSCETYFSTMKNWRDCLRFTPISKSEAVFLMTDGITNFALSEDMCRLKAGFIEPINTYLQAETNKQKALKALHNTLDTKQARRLNSDDKTFLWAGL